MSFNFLDLNFWEDFFIIFFSYSILKYIIFSVIIELIWPTNYFNRKHFISLTFKKYRTMTELVLKLKKYNNYNTINFFCIYLFLLK